MLHKVGTVVRVSQATGPSALASVQWDADPAGSTTAVPVRSLRKVS